MTNAGIFEAKRVCAPEVIDPERHSPAENPSFIRRLATAIASTVLMIISLVCASSILVSLFAVSAAQATISTYNHTSSPNNFTAIYTNGAGETITVTGLPANTACVSVDAAGRWDLFATASNAACDQSLSLTFTHSSAQIGAMTFSDIDDIDGIAPRDSFAANVPGTWTSPTIEVHSFASPPAYADQAGRLSASGGVGTFLANDAGNNPTNEQATFTLANPINSFTIYFDDVEGARNARAFFDLSGSTLETFEPEVTVTKTLESTSFSNPVAAGDTITYRYRLLNTGDTDVDNVLPVDPGPTFNGAAGSGTMGTFVLDAGASTNGTDDITPGDDAEFTAVYTLSAGDVANIFAAADPTTAIDNTANATGTPTDGTLTSVPGSNETGVPVADLVTVKTLSSADPTPLVGDTVSFLITVTNNGPSPATNVSLTDSLPTGLTLTGNTPSGGTTYNTGSGLWTIGALGNGASATLTLTGTVDAGQGGNTLTNVTTAATGDESDPDAGTDDLDESVTVDQPVIAAVDDDFSGTPINGLTGGNTPTVFTNDTLGGAPFASADVTPTITADGGLTGVTINADGTLTIPANTPAGPYSVTYQICEVANPANCDTAIVSVVVDPAPIVAVDDDFSASPVNGLDGGTTASTFTNDTLNGAPFAPADVTPSITNDGGLTGVTINPDGTLNVPAGTPTGSFTVTYEICENLNPTNCDTAVATVVVDPAPIVAVDDDFSGSPTNGLAGGNTPTVFTNDTLNGAPFAPADVTPSIANDGGLTGVSVNADGTLTVPAGTPVGSYSVTYQICENLNPANCDTAVATVNVTAATIVATDDDFSGSPVNGLDGGNTPTVFTNDTLNGIPFAPAAVTPSITNDGGLTGVAINADGTLTVPAGTPAGPYSVTYQICEVLNPANCDTAVASVVVDPAPIVATDDPVAGVNGLTGATGVVDVFANDTLNSNPVNPADVTLTETVPDPNGFLTLNPNGTVDVAPGTPAGTYQLTYQICENLNPTNCDTAVASVTVDPAPIVAVDDDFTGSPTNGLTGGNTPTVFTNDTLNGAPFAPADVTPSITADGGLTGVVINADGTLTVPAGTPAGPYSVTYQICEVLNPANCDTAIASVVVDPAPIVAVDDDFTGSPTNGLTGGSTPTVFTNDTLNGAPFAPADVTPTIAADGGLTGVTINADGTLDVPAGTPTGTYSVTYQICENLNPANCDTAVATVVVDPAPIVATDDDFSGSPTNGLTGGNTPTVFINDTLNGNPFAPADVTPTITADGGLTGVAINADGTLAVPAGTPTGTYSVTYQICENLNPANCDTAVATVVVDPAPIVAVDDDFSGAPTNGLTGGNTPTVFTNDTLNGAPFAPTDVTPTITADGGLTGVTINADGTLAVPAGTPTGTYSVTYQICENLNPANCDTAVATVVVDPAPIVAVDDDFSGSPTNGLTGGNTPTVFTNDTLNGAPFAPADVTPSITADGGLTGVAINADGTLAVPAGTPTGTYPVTYQICENLNPTNCDTAVATVVVDPAPIVAVDDDLTGSPVNGAAGGSTPTVFTNDTLNGNPFAAADVTPTITNDGGLTGVIINADGTMNVPAGTPAGNYSVTYQICEVLNPANCDTAVATVNITAATIVATDDDFSGTPFNGLDGGTTPTVFPNDTLNGNPFAPANVAPTITADGGLTGVAINPDGTLTVPTDTPAGTYTVTYQICENLNPANCDTAAVTIVVDPAPIVAVDDDFTGSPTNGLTGGNTPTVFTNDTLNGAPFASADVTPTIIADGGLTGVTINADGTLAVPANTPTGTYSVTYQICEVLNPTNCDTAIATVAVDPAPIVATDDDFSASPTNGLTGGNTPTVYTNDTLNGAPFAPADVTPSITADGGLTGVAINADGTLSVPAGTPTGTYSVTYQICENLNPANCDTAVATVVVDPAPIVATDDTVTGVNGVTGGTGVADVFANDTLNGNPVNPADVTLTETVPDPNGYLTLNPNGTVDVAPGTPAGTYSLTYQICENLNPANCDTAVVSVTVDAAPIVAVDDDFSGAPVNGTAGGNTPTTFTNDTLNGAAFAPADVTPTITADGGLTGVTINADGTLTVPAGTPAGTYSVTYQICENLNPANCDTAIATVNINAATIVASDDDLSGSPVNGLDGGNTPTLFSNDTLNGNPFAPADVTPTIVLDGGLTGVTINPDGTLTVPADTPAGTYPVTYQICENLNPANCDTATATVTVDPAPIDAMDDTVAGVDGTAGGTNVVNVFGNDTLNGDPVNPTDVTLTETVPDPNGFLTLNPDGSVDVAPGTPAGTYQLTYQICENLNPANCDTAVVTVTAGPGVIAAVDDDLSGSPVNGTDGGNTPTVFTNDTLNGNPVNPADITPTITADGGLTGVVINPDGTLTVPPGTPAGTYPVTYQICENLNPTNCDTATATVTVDAAPIIATDDTATGVNGTAGGTGVLNVFDNDTLNGNPVIPADVTLTETVPDPNGFLTLNPDGTVDVAPDTPAGTYQVTYQICENLNPANCDTAVASVTVDAAPITADADSVSGVDGGTGDPDAGNVLTNDTLNGNPVDPADVTLTVTSPATPASPGAPVPAVDPATGTISVLPGTPAGIYAITYEICEVLNPANCATTTAMVGVDAPTIVADDDTVVGVNGTDGSPDAGNVLTNDSLGGNSVDPADVTLTVTTPATPVTPGAPVPSVDPATGTISVPPNTPAGTYTITYQICEVLNPANCETAVASVTVDPAPIVATDDIVPPVNGEVGNPDAGNVLTNDTLNGDPVDPADISVTVVTPASDPGVVLDPATGTISVAPNTPAGTYTITYQICENLNPTNCETATATIETIPVATVSGTIFNDANGNGSFEPGTDPVVGAGYIVEVRDAAGNPVDIFDANGNPVQSVVTDANGEYDLQVAPGTDYRIVFSDPNGKVVGGLPNIDLVAGQNLIDQNLPIDPSGVVFDSTTRLPIAGVTVALTNAAGTPLPPICFIAASQQNQTTDASGNYRFDIVPGAAALCPAAESEYRITYTNPANYLAGTSVALPPQPGPLDATTCPGDAIPGGACQPEAGNNPPTNGPVNYFLSFLLEPGDPNVINNHIPLDPVTAPSGLTKTALIAKVKRGQKVPYRINSTDVNLPGVTIVDRMPVGFSFVPGSARVNGATVTPTVNGRDVIFGGVAPDAARNVEIQLMLAATARVTTGEHVNTALMYNPADGSLIASATATVEVEVEHVFDCGDIIGKVYDDKNRNGYQNKGEPGLPGVRIATVKGLLITTDKHGRFHVACADLPDKAIGSNFIMKLDTRTLPTGYRMTTENPRVIRLTRGKTSKLNFGASISRVVRLDLKNAAFVDGSTELRPRWRDGIGRLISILEEETSVLRITYRANGGGKKLARQRTKIVAAGIRDIWKQRGGGYDLAIEQRVVGAGQ